MFPAGLAISLLPFQNCGGGLSSSTGQFNQASSQVSDGLDTDTPNNKPVIDCRFSSAQRSDVYARINTIQDSYSANRFNENDALAVDCSSTYDESGVDSLNFSIDTDYDSTAPNFQTFSKQFGLSAFAPGIYNMALRVTDPQGEISIKPFSLVVECSDAIPAPTIANVASAVQVSAGSEVGLYNFAVDMSQVSGGSGFEFAWDFNGDGVMDPFATGRNGSRDLWTNQAQISNQYANVTNVRKIKLNVRNSCFKITSYTLDKNLPASHPVARNATSLATVTPYYYLQGDARSSSLHASSVHTQRANADYLATDNTGHLEFTCDFNRSGNNGLSSLRINTAKRYRDEDYSRHGASINITNIPDSGADGTQTINPGQALISSMSYRVAGESDGLVNDTYNMTSACEIKMRIIRATSTVPCSTGPARTVQSIEFLGEFSCPQLTSERSGSTISFTNGKFYCGDSISDSCQGGGGGGGGQPPPQF